MEIPEFNWMQFFLALPHQWQTVSGPRDACIPQRAAASATLMVSGFEPCSLQELDLVKESWEGFKSPIDDLVYCFQSFITLLNVRCSSQIKMYNFGL